MVMEPFWVAAGISKSSSGMVTVAESDLTTCLHPRRCSGRHPVTATEASLSLLAFQATGPPAKFLSRSCSTTHSVAVT